MEQKSDKQETEKNHEKDQAENVDAKKSFSWQNLLGIIGILIIVFILVSPFDKQKNIQEKTAEEDSEMTEVTETANETETNTQPSSKIQNKMAPVIDGDFTYSFKDIEWEFNKLEATTNVNFRLTDFTRREGSIASINNPFRLGFFPGTCQEFDPKTISSDTSPISSLENYLAMASCQNPDTGNTEIIAITQNKENPKLIQALVNTSNNQSWTEIFSVDMTTIIK